MCVEQCDDHAAGAADRFGERLVITDAEAKKIAGAREEERTKRAGGGTSGGQK